MTTIHWHEVPFVRIAVPFILGILIAQWVPGYFPAFLAAGCSVVLSIIVTVFRSPGLRQQLRTALLPCLAITAGIVLRKLHEPNPSEITRIASLQTPVYSIVEDITTSSSGKKARIRIIPPTTRLQRMTVIAYFPDSLEVFLPGDTLILMKAVQKIPAAPNPFAFDLAGMYRRQGIYLKANLYSSGDFVHRPLHNRFLIRRACAQARKSVERIFHRNVHTEENCAVLLAMTVGVVDGISDQTYDAYAKTGAIHVLSISGLHVGIVSSMLMLLIGRIRADDPHIRKIFRTTVFLLAIWTFAFIAGLSPSITRATFMMSVYLIGVMLRRNVRGMNVIAFTACVCLAINPYQINSISFQFSYLALAGLMIFHQPIYRWIAVRGVIPKFVWGTIVMSVAAQVLLVPFLIYYFQQLSLISSISSLVAIPASYLILIGGILILCIDSLFPGISLQIGGLLDIGIGTTNALMSWMSTLPMSHLDNVYASPAEIWLLFAAGILLALRTVTAKHGWTYSLLIPLTLFALIRIQAIVGAEKNRALAIYPHPELLALDLIQGDQCKSSFELSAMASFQASEVQAFRNASRIRSVIMTDSIPVSHSGAQVIEFDQNHGDQVRIVFLQPGRSSPVLSEILWLAPDYVVISDATPWTREAIEKMCVEHHIRFHDLRYDGAFYLTSQFNVQ